MDDVFRFDELLLAYTEVPQEVDRYSGIASQIALDLPSKELVDLTLARVLSRELCSQYLHMLGLTTSVAVVILLLHQNIKMTVKLR